MAILIILLPMEGDRRAPRMYNVDYGAILGDSCDAWPIVLCASLIFSNFFISLRIGVGLYTLLILRAIQVYVLDHDHTALLLPVEGDRDKRSEWTT